MQLTRKFLLTATVNFENPSELGWRSLAAISCVLALFAANADTSWAQSQELSAIPAGTVVEAESKGVWNRIVLLAKPRVASGDINALSKSIRNTVSTYTLCILASVQQTSSGDFQFREIGAGYAMELERQLKIVTVRDFKKVGASLGFIQKQMLSTNEEQLKTVDVVYRSPTIWIFDTPALVHSKGEHIDLTFRHLVTLSGKTGQVSTFVWLLRESGDAKYAVLRNPIRYVAQGTEEDRKIHVDGGEFMLGIPSKRAFAVDSLPPGADIDWNTQAVDLAGTKQFNDVQVRDLVMAVNAAIQDSQQQTGQGQTAQQP